MTIKELQQLIKLCRTQGVQSIKYNDVELHLGDMPSKGPRRASSIQRDVVYSPGGITSETKIEVPDELSPEALLFWSSASSQEQNS